MKIKKNNYSTKKSDLSNWIDLEKIQYSEGINNTSTNLNNLNQDLKPKLAFGYGYNPEILRKGISKFSYSHSLNNELKLYEFEPKISYRIFNVLAKILKYKCVGSELKKNNTIIKNKYFITDEKPEQVIKELNMGIKEIFEIYEPIHKHK